MITEQEIRAALGIIKQSILELPGLKGAQEDRIIPPSEKKVKIGIEN